MRYIKLFEAFILESNSVNNLDPFLDYRLDLGTDKLKDGVLYLIYSYSPGGQASLGFLDKETIKKLQDSYNKGIDYTVFLALLNGDSESTLKGIDYIKSRIWGSSPEIYLLLELKDSDKYILIDESGNPGNILKDLRSEKTQSGIDIKSNKGVSAGKFITSPEDYEPMLKKWPYNEMTPEELKNLRDQTERLGGLSGTMGSINGIPVPNSGIKGVPSLIVKKEVIMSSSKSYQGENSGDHAMYNIPIKKNYFFGFNSQWQSTGFFLSADEWMSDDNDVSEFMSKQVFSEILEEDEFSEEDVNRAFFKLVDLGVGEEIIGNIADALRGKKKSSGRNEMTLEEYQHIIKPLFYLWASGYDDSIKSCPGCCKEIIYPQSGSYYNMKKVPGYIKRESDGEILHVGLGCEVCEESFTSGLISNESPDNIKRKTKILMDFHPEWFYGSREIQPFVRVYERDEKINKSDPLKYDVIKNQGNYEAILRRKWKDVTTQDQQKLGIMRFSNQDGIYAYDIEIDPKKGVSKISKGKIEKVKDEDLDSLDLRTHSGYNKALLWILQNLL